MTVKFFSRRRNNGPQSTQFAATVVGLPGTDMLVMSGGGAGVDADAPNPDTLSPDSLVSLATESSGANAAVPDVVTDIGGLPSQVPDPADAPTISHIGRYALKRQLGSGGIGTVFEAWDPLLSRAVAVKTLQFDVEHSARVSLDGLFLNEARAAASLNHRYIVTIHDAGLSAHGVYIAMERLYGRDLQQALAEGWKPSIDQSVQLVRRVAEALAYAHAHGVVHCDIKPANIFLQRRDRPKVLDFGIARIAHGVSLPALDGAVAGSPRYRAPEQLTGAPVDARADLFSLGVVMYELLTGRRAFEGETLADINDAVLNHDPKPAHEVEPRVPPALSAIVARLMARSPADRCTCASELSADLRRWVHEQQALQQALQLAAQGTAPGRSSALAKAPSSPAALRWMTAGAAVLAVAALAAALMPWRNSAPLSSPSLPPLPAAVAVNPGSTVAPPTPGATADQAGTEEATASTADSAAGPQAAAAGAEPPPSMETRPEAQAISTAPAVPAVPEPPPPRTRPLADPALRSTAAAPRSAAAVTGTVQLLVSPWAELEVDGKDGGMTPPVQRLTLSEGNHTITLRHPDHAPHTMQVQVAADKPATLRHRFGN